MEFRHLLATGDDKAIELIEKINQEFLTKFGRSYHNGLFKTYNMEDAEDVIVTMGSLGSESISAVNSLRKKGIKCGLVNIRSYRPFPGKILSETLKNAKNIVVFDKNISYGHEGALCSDLKSSLYTFKVFGPSVLGVICGLGGRNISYTEIAETIEKFKNKKLGNEKPYWLNSNPE
jgi:pyruvate/2-oxoacid:ferredoxin oxidoreductase alpha subunit